MLVHIGSNTKISGRECQNAKKVWAHTTAVVVLFNFLWLWENILGNGQKWVYPPLFQTNVGGGKMQTSSPLVITPNRSQSNPDDMITLPRPIQSVGIDLHDVSGTSTGQTLPRERRAPPGTHLCPTNWWVYPPSAKTPGVVTICGWSAAGRRPTPGLQQQLQGSCARVRRFQTPGVITICGWSAAGCRPNTRSAVAAARILRPCPQVSNARRHNHLRMVRGGAQTHTRSAAVTDV